MVKNRVIKSRIGKTVEDCLDFYVEEYAEDVNLKAKDTMFYNSIPLYNFFKKKEQEFLSEADHTISLTYKGRDEIHSWNEIPGQPIPIEVIPCCADLEHFKAENADQGLKSTNTVAFDTTSLNLVY